MPQPEPGLPSSCKHTFLRPLGVEWILRGQGGGAGPVQTAFLTIYCWPGQRGVSRLWLLSTVWGSKGCPIYYQNQGHVLHSDVPIATNQQDSLLFICPNLRQPPSEGLSLASCIDM